MGADCGGVAKGIATTEQTEVPDGRQRRERHVHEWQVHIVAGTELKEREMCGQVRV